MKHRMNQWINKSGNQWFDDLLNQLTNELNLWINECVSLWVDESMQQWISQYMAWIDEPVSRRFSEAKCICEPPRSTEPMDHEVDESMNQWPKACMEWSGVEQSGAERGGAEWRWSNVRAALLGTIATVSCTSCRTHLPARNASVL